MNIDGLGNAEGFHQGGPFCGQVKERPAVVDERRQEGMVVVHGHVHDVAWSARVFIRGSR